MAVCADKVCCFRWPCSHNDHQHEIAAGKKTIMKWGGVIKSMEKRRDRWTIFSCKKTAAEAVCCIGALPLNGALRQHGISSGGMRPWGHLGWRERDLSRMIMAEKWLPSIMWRAGMWNRRCPCSLPEGRAEPRWRLCQRKKFWLHVKEFSS